MSSFPNFSNVPSHVKSEIAFRQRNPLSFNNMNAWIRLASNAGDGCVLYSNPDFSLFRAAGSDVGSIYGNSESAGAIGKTWDGKGVIYATGEIQPYKPKPNITSIEVDEGSGNLSRKASFSIKVYTLAQLEQISKYFLEPGFTIFLEWGWNKPKSLVGFKNQLTVDYVAKAQSFAEINKRRIDTGGLYDCYLGFITGGSIGIQDDGWTVDVKCTGFVELPAYLMSADNTKTVAELEAQKNKNGTAPEGAKKYPTGAIFMESDLGRKRFMQMFNKLSSNRQTNSIKDLIKKTDASGVAIANPVNFINFDEAVKDSINNKTDGALFGIFKNSSQVSSNGKSVSFPTGTKIIGDDAYIRFGTLMQIINSIGINGYRLGSSNGKLVKMRINTANTVISAFPKIFSADKSKLFIPNPKTPKFDLEKAATTTEPQNTYTGEFDNSVSYKETIIKFPQDKSIINGKVDGGRQIEFTDDNIKGISKDAEQWGFLDDLYVNFDFAKGILETKNFLMKDALYQILNALSSAAGGLWDFQIVEKELQDEMVSGEAAKTTELSVVDLNCTSAMKDELSKIIQFECFGVNSIFMDASFDMDISGAKMNQIIGQRLSNSINPSRPSMTVKLFATDMSDQILTYLETTAPSEGEANAAPNENSSTDEEAEKQKNLELFLQKVGIFPKVSLIKGQSSFSGAIENLVYIGCLNDLVVFDNLKAGNEIIESEKPGSVSILMPIKFTFTIHGISGIKRGDKFRVNGIPKKYSDSGFFQVLSVKHTIDGMIWKTEVEGGFRQIQLKK